VAFAHDIVDDDEDFDENLPFMAVEPRSKQKQTRRGGQRRRLNHEDALEALYGLRNELEVRADWGLVAVQGIGLLVGLHAQRHRHDRQQTHASVIHWLDCPRLVVCSTVCA
jgi:hypothetical protein